MVLRTPTWDMPTLARHFVGMDRLFDELDRRVVQTTGNYPPHNIIKVDDLNYELEFGVAGFSRSELEVEFKDNVLTLRGKKHESSEKNYVFQGLAKRNFVKTIGLTSDYEVTGADMRDGLLVIKIQHIVPEQHKPKLIPIN